MIHTQSSRSEKERPTPRAPEARDARIDPRSDMRSTTASIHSLHAFGRKGEQRERPSVGRRIFRTLTRFVVTVLIGVGGTLAWQSYGDMAREMVAAQAPALAWLAPSRSPAAASTNPAQQPALVAANLDALRRYVEQLAARQDQIAQSLVMMQAIEADVRQKMAFTPPSAAIASAPPAAVVQQYKPAQRARSSAAQ
jgi:hypothetical protein